VKSVDLKVCPCPRPTKARNTTSPRDIQSTTTTTMPKALTFKGDKPKPKKRKRTQEEKDDGPSAKQLVPSGDAPAEAEEDENWVSVDNVSDLAGPVMLVFSSEPVMSLACDQLGTVFASKVENMVEGVASSAEPHDVRQVFVATRVVGSESDVVFKGCNGR
jgi:protein FRG1